MKVSNLENLRFSPGKPYISQNSQFLDHAEKAIEQVIKNRCKINEFSIQKSLQNRSAEKYRKMVPKGSKMDAQSSHKIAKMS